MNCSKCGESFVPRAWQVLSRDHRCLPCKRAQQNTSNALKGDALKTEAQDAYRRRIEYYKAYWSNARNDPLHIVKRAARRKVATEIEAGRLVRLPCQRCKAPNADAHHADYLQPLHVEWLCRRCHFAVERSAA